MPPGTNYAQPFDLPAGSSGVLFINRTGELVSVAVSNTIATLPLGQIYLFVLPPGNYDFFIYGLDTPLVQAEQTEAGEVRYVYLLPFASNKPSGD